MRWLAVLSAYALTIGCVEPETTSTTCGGVALEGRLLVLESDLRTTSGLGVADESGCLTEVAGGLAFSGDTALAASAGRFFVLDRVEALVHEIDPVALRIERTDRASGPAEPRTNPQDVALDAAGRRWITRFSQATVAIVGGEAGFAEVDLSPFADADGLPEAAGIHIASGTAFIALQRLDADAEGEIYPPAGPGGLARVDVGDPSTLTAIDLEGRNPFGDLVPALHDPTLLTVATPGSFDEITPGDGVERIDTVTFTSRAVITEPALGGSATRALIAGPAEGYAIVAGTAGGIHPTRVVAFDPTAGEVTRTLAEAEGYYHWDLAVIGRYLAVADRTPGHAGIRFFERETGAPAGELVAQQMAPVSLIALP